MQCIYPLPFEKAVVENDMLLQKCCVVGCSRVPTALTGRIVCRCECVAFCSPECDRTGHGDHEPLCVAMARERVLELNFKRLQNDAVMDTSDVAKLWLMFGMGATHTVVAWPFLYHDIKSATERDLGRAANIAYMASVDGTHMTSSFIIAGLCAANVLAALPPDFAFDFMDVRTLHKCVRGMAYFMIKTRDGVHPIPRYRDIDVPDKITANYVAVYFGAFKQLTLRKDGHLLLDHITSSLISRANLTLDDVPDVGASLKCAVSKLAIAHKCDDHIFREAVDRTRNVASMTKEQLEHELDVYMHMTLLRIFEVGVLKTDTDDVNVLRNDMLFGLRDYMAGVELTESHHRMLADMLQSPPSPYIVDLAKLLVKERGIKFGVSVRARLEPAKAPSATFMRRIRAILSGKDKCAACGKQPKGLQACADCHCEVYCNRECQRLAWPAHRASHHAPAGGVCHGYSK